MTGTIGSSVARTAARLAAAVALGATTVGVVPPAFAMPAQYQASLVQTVDVSAFTPPSPDASGVTYLPASGHLLMADSEVDELPALWKGANLYEITAGGTLVRTGSTMAYSAEPTGLGFDPVHSTLYVTDDDTLTVWMVGAGADGLFGTVDDTTGSFSVAAFSSDPQGPAFDTATGDLFVVDGAGNEVFRISPGPDGAFDGTDDVVASFSAKPYGAGRPQGITYDPARNSLFVCDNRSRALYEVDAAGTLLASVHIPASAPLPGGCDVAVAPSSTTPGRSSFWVTTRGVDSTGHPGQNDGKLYELTADLFGPPAPGPGPVGPPAPGPGPATPPAVPPGPAGGPGGQGYAMAASDGGIFTFGSEFRGSAGGRTLARPIVSLVATPSRGGYWLVADDGGIFSYGSARFHGSTGSIKLARPIVGMASTPSGEGYWLVASDGGIFAFGDAGFYGSTGNIKLARPIVGMASTASGRGYWLVASDGGTFAFGDAHFHGSTGNLKLAKPIVGMARTATSAGYWLLASDGGIFAFGDAAFRGSTGAVALARPIVGMAVTPSGAGYWLVASDGGIFAFGDALFQGSTGNLRLARPIVGVAAA